MPVWDGFQMVDGDGRYGGWIQTYTGKKFYPLDPRLEDVDFEDIAVALSNQARFSGHTAYAYSVAQHSVHVARVVEELGGGVMEQLWGLAHDFPEAYLVDLPRPIKHSPGFEAYTAAEENLMRVISRFCGLPFAQPHLVEMADRILLATERRDLLGPECHWEVPGVTPLGWTIRPWASLYARQELYRTFVQLTRRLNLERGTANV